MSDIQAISIAAPIVVVGGVIVCMCCVIPVCLHWYGRNPATPVDSHVPGSARGSAGGHGAVSGSPPVDASSGRAVAAGDRETP